MRTSLVTAVAVAGLGAAAAVSVASDGPADADSGSGKTGTTSTTPTTSTTDGQGSTGGQGSDGQQPSNTGSDQQPTRDGSDGDQHQSDTAQVATADVEPGSGRVTITLPDGHTLPLTAAGHLPAGTVIDATDGSVTLDGPDGRPGTFSGGSFVVGRTSGAHPLDEVKLVGGDFSGCPNATHARARAELQAAGRRSHKRVVRRLWGRDHGGSFRTRGSNATASVRGTVWLTQDRCDGTRVVVRQGEVVVRDKVRHRDVVVRAGHSYLARSAKR